ncbi:hypothetical protein CB1_000185012 [Camelus ferus]|nr:hypothetical protein CB1_000185012 [Camelus ferus]
MLWLLPPLALLGALAAPEGSQVPAAHSKAEGTICFTCSDIYHCDPLPCTEDRNYCLQMAGVAALGKDNCVAWTNYSCVAFNDCTFDNFISTLMYSIGFGFWINITCCQGNCQEPPPLGPCNHSFYMQCPSGETECVQMNLVSEEGDPAGLEGVAGKSAWFGENPGIWGWRRGDGASGDARVPGVPVQGGHLPARILTSRSPRASPQAAGTASQRAVMDSECYSGAAPGAPIALPLLVVALGIAALS